MKTITLDDAAYSRLKAWKQGSKESFSSVIKRVLPEPGTLGSFLAFVHQHHTAQLSGNEAMEETLQDSPSGKHDPWT